MSSAHSCSVVADKDSLAVDMMLHLLLCPYSYVGGWNSGHPHGQGNMTYIDGSQYKGQWDNGVKTGKGDFTSVSETHKQSCT